jgi:hypothetical protein
MPKQISPDQRIIRLERENVMLRQRILNLERKMDKTKADYEKKLKVKSKIVISEEQRQKLLARRDKALAANARLRSRFRQFRPG